MKRRLSVAFWITATLSAASLAAAAYFGVGCFNARRGVDAARTAEPLSMSVDLSAPGTYSGPATEIYTSSHGRAFYLELRPAPDIHFSPYRTFTGLEATLTIVDAKGQEAGTLLVSGKRLADESPQPGPQGAPSNQFYVGSLRSVAEGPYIATLTVTHGAPGMTGIEERLVERYGLCGLEGLLVTVLGALTIGSLVVATLMGALGL